MAGRRASSSKSGRSLPSLIRLHVRLFVLVIWVPGCLMTDARSGIAGETEPDSAPDKNVYSLFKPTPRGSMRELNTDRPDQTESPYTVDAGHFQFELDFLNATFDQARVGGRDLQTRSWSATPLNVKVGLLNNMDLQFLVDTYVRSRVVERTLQQDVERASGLGDFRTRLKINFWGNDDGRTAFGVIPFMKWPLSRSDLRNGRTEAGIIVPFAVDLGSGWGLAAMTELDVLANEGAGYDSEFVNSVSVGRDVTERLGLYLEFVTVTGSAPEFRWQGQFDSGATYLLGASVQIDAGCNFGVTDSAPDFNPFVGLSFRF